MLPTQETLTSLILTISTRPKTNIAPENRPSQKKSSLPTIHFQVRTVSFREGILALHFSSKKIAIRNKSDLPPSWKSWEITTQQGFVFKEVDLAQIYTEKTGDAGRASEKNLQVFPPKNRRWKPLPSKKRGTICNKSMYFQFQTFLLGTFFGVSVGLVLFSSWSQSEDNIFVVVSTFLIEVGMIGLQ